MFGQTRMQAYKNMKAEASKMQSPGKPVQIQKVVEYSERKHRQQYRMEDHRGPPQYAELIERPNEYNLMFPMKDSTGRRGSESKIGLATQSPKLVPND